MEKRTVLIYDFKDLSSDARKQAIENIIGMFISNIPYEDLSDNMKKAVDIAEEKQTPWFTGSYIWEYAEGEVLQECRANKFTKFGDFVPWSIIESN